MKRRRYATRNELAEQLADLRQRAGDPDPPTVDQVARLLDTLGALGVPIDALVRIEVDEGTTDHAPGHRYLSTACLHGQCDTCRQTCKYCDAACTHNCHQQAG